MYIFSVSRTKPNGMDDVDVNKLSDSTPVVMYKKFFGEKIYDWKHSTGDIFSVSFKVKDITLCYGGGYRVWCEVLSLNYKGEAKISLSKLNLLQSYFRKVLNTDLSLCSIDDVDVINVSAIDDQTLSLGHGYYSSRPILNDIFLALIGIETKHRLFIYKSELFSSEKYFLRK